MLLEVRDLKTHFFTEDGVVRAVDGISYSVARGEVLCIVGESGSGKSVSSLSTMRLIPDPPGRIVAGQILLEEGEGRTTDLAKLDERAMQRIRGKRVAMIFQDPMTSLNPYLRISDQLVEVLVLHEGLRKAAARERAIDMLKAVGIPDPARRLDDHPHHLSGGMRQRVMIAMALLCSPELLIADEPTTALDVTTQAQILELLLDRKDARSKEGMGLGIVLITHDLGVVARVADRVAVMYAGHIVEESPVAELFADPRHPYTVGLARSIPSLEGDRSKRLVPIPGMPPLLSKVPKGCPFAARCPAVRPECHETFPEMREVGPGHRVACHETDADAVRRPPPEVTA